MPEKEATQLKLFVASIGSNAPVAPSGQPLKFAERDASRFQQSVATQRAYDLAENWLHNDNVYSRDAMRMLQKLLDSATPADHVVLFFAGHGIIESTPRGTQLFLGVHGTALEDISSTAINLQQLLEAVQESHARSCTLLLDCCFSGGLHARSISGPRYLADLSAGRKIVRRAPRIQGEGRLVLGAAKKERQAYESATLKAGFFTHHLLQALYAGRKAELMPTARVYADLLVAVNYATDGQQIPILSGDDGGSSLPTIQTIAKEA